MKFIRKSLMALAVACAAQSVSAADNLFGRFAMEGVDIIGSVPYGQVNSYEAMTSGYYLFGYDNKYQAQLTSPLLKAKVSGGSTYHDGKIYACEYDDGYRLGDQKPHWIIYDAKTFKVLTDIEKGSNYELTTSSITYDPTTNKIYGICRLYMETWLVEIDPETGNAKRIGDILDNRYRYECVGCDSKGILYMIYMETLNNDEGSDAWYLDKVRKTDGKMVRVGEISVENLFTGDSYVNDTRKQSLFCNFNTGKMYWMYPSSSSFLNKEITAITELNTSTAVATFKAYLSTPVLTSGAFFREPAKKAPAVISDFKFQADAPAALNGKMQFRLPETSYDGSKMTGAVKVLVVEDKDTLVNTESTPGALFTSSDMAFTNDNHEVAITVSNADGEGPTVKRSFFVGYDTPSACTNVKLTSDGLKTTLTWDAPTVGESGAPVNTEALTYKVVRYPYEVTVAEGLKECKFEEEHPSDMTRYVYLVTPSADGYDGPGTYSNNLIVGTPLDVPYGGAFTGPADMLNYYTILDSNSDGYSWGYTVKQASAIYQYNPQKAADDWLISPPINYKKGHTYVLTFMAHSTMEDYPEAMVVTFGNGKAPDAQSQVLLNLEQVPTPPLLGNDNTYNLEFTVPEDGVYYYGFHCVSPAYHSILYLHDISVKDKEDTSVSSKFASDATVKSVTNLGGQRVNGMQRGVNILKMSDGSTKKVIVK